MISFCNLSHQNAEFKDFLQLLSLIVLIPFGMNYPRALSIVRDKVVGTICSEFSANVHWLKLFFGDLNYCLE